MTEIVDFAGQTVGDDACTLGEGPTYDPARDTVFWFDIVERKLFELEMGSGTIMVHELPFMASVLAVIDRDRQLIAADNGLYIRDAGTGALSLHTPLEADNGATRSNDGRVHQSGALWIGTMGRRAEKQAGAIYWFGKGELRLLYPRISIPNAICFSPDGGTGYFTDTAIGVLHRVAIDPETGLPVGEPEIFHDQRGGEGGLDGAVVDADGLLWNARWGGAALDAYRPDGTRAKTVRLPVSQPSCPAFVGTRADRLLVTSAFQDMNDAARGAEPLAGRTLLLDLPVRGRFEPSVRLT